MRILGDSNITDADVTATNVLAASFTEKIKNFQLSDKLETLTNTTNIDFTFNGTIPDINMIGLCGTNLTATSVISVSYSATDISSPDATETITTFSTLNQVLFLSSTLNKKYWRVSITDTALSSLFVGYLYCGVYIDIPYVRFGISPSLDIFSNSTVTPTGQGYGGKIYNAKPIDFTMLLTYAELLSFVAIKEEKQNVDMVLLIQDEDSYDNVLYRPKYGILASSVIPYPQTHDTLRYSIAERLEERF